MSEGFRKEPKPYEGLIIGLLFLTATPLVLYKITYSILRFFEKEKAVIVNAEAESFAGIMASAAVLTMLLSGGLQKEFAAVRKRLREFRLDLQSNGLKSAMHWYWYNIKQLGVAFWIYLPFVALSFVMMIHGFLDFYKYYFAK